MHRTYCAWCEKYSLGFPQLEETLALTCSHTYTHTNLKSEKYPSSTYTFSTTMQ